MTKGPLAGLRVLEIQALGPLALAGTLLADLGADVILVARPGWLREGGASPNQSWRGRSVVELDLKTGVGRCSFLEAATRADVVLEGFRPGVMERLGIGPEVLHAHNERLIIGRMTGWGQEGLRSQTAGHDINYLSTTGHLAAITDNAGQPVIPLNLLGDYGGGTMFLLVGVLSALVERAESGMGQVIDAAMVDGASMLGHWIWAMRGVGRWADEPRTNMLDGGRPWYNIYKTRDDKYMAVGALEPAFYAEFLKGLGLDGSTPEKTAPEREDPANWPRLQQLFAECFAAHDQAHWEETFLNTDACVTPVRTYAEAETDAHLKSRKTLVNVNNVVQPAPAPRFSRTATPTPEGSVRVLSSLATVWQSEIQ